MQVLNKIYEHIKSILNYCSDCSNLNEFRLNNMRVEACVFNLMQIGYAGVEMKIVWETISEDYLN